MSSVAATTPRNPLGFGFPGRNPKTFWCLAATRKVENLKGFLLSSVRARIGKANGPAWGALKKHRQLSPERRRAAFLSGIAQDEQTTVEPTAHRLNDNLKGLWDQSGSGQEHPSTLGRTMGKQE